MNWEERKRDRKPPAPSNESKLHSHEAAPYYTEDLSLQDSQDFHTPTNDFPQRRQQDFQYPGDQRSDSRYLQELKEKSVFLESQLHGSRLKLIHMEKENEKLQQDLNESSYSKKTSVLELEIESLRSALDIKTKQCESLEKALKGERNKHLNELAELRNKLKMINENFFMENRPLVNEDQFEINELREDNKRLRNKINSLIQEHEKTVDELKNELNEQYLHFKQLLEDSEARYQQEEDFRETVEQSYSKLQTINSQENFRKNQQIIESRIVDDVKNENIEKKIKSNLNQPKLEISENKPFGGGLTKETCSFDGNFKPVETRLDEGESKSSKNSFSENIEAQLIGKKIENPAKEPQNLLKSESASIFKTDHKSKKAFSPLKPAEIKVEPKFPISKDINPVTKPFETSGNTSKVNSNPIFPEPKKENFLPNPVFLESTTFNTIQENPSKISTFFDDPPGPKDLSLKNSSQISDFFTEKEEKPEIFNLFDKPNFFAENIEIVPKLSETSKDLNFVDPIQQFFTHEEESKPNCFENLGIDENELEPQNSESSENIEKFEQPEQPWSQTNPDFGLFDNSSSPADFFSSIKPTSDYQSIPSSLFDV